MKCMKRSSYQIDEFCRYLLAENEEGINLNIINVNASLNTFRTNKVKDRAKSERKPR